MWRDICVANRDALSGAMAAYIAEMEALAEVIRDGDGERLLEIFSRAKAARDRYVDGILDAPE